MPPTCTRSPAPEMHRSPPLVWRRPAGAHLQDHLKCSVASAWEQHYRAGIMYSHSTRDNAMITRSTCNRHQAPCKWPSHQNAAQWVPRRTSDKLWRRHQQHRPPGAWCGFILMHQLAGPVRGGQVLCALCASALPPGGRPDATAVCTCRLASKAVPSSRLLRHPQVLPCCNWSHLTVAVPKRRALWHGPAGCTAGGHRWLQVIAWWGAKWRAQWEESGQQHAAAAISRALWRQQPGLREPCHLRLLAGLHRTGERSREAVIGMQAPAAESGRYRRWPVRPLPALACSYGLI